MLILISHDCNKLQYYFNQLNICSSDELNLNTDKWFQITFTRNKHNLNSHYQKNNKSYDITYKIKDSEIILSSDLSFITEHINVFSNKTFRVFGFLNRNCWEFHDPLYNVFYIFHSFGQFLNMDQYLESIPSLSLSQIGTNTEPVFINVSI
jgi:hypothetical protein